jgi:membrane associated rhomboid family serine protease/Zn-finger nucleic acid-binding protein
MTVVSFVLMRPCPRCTFPLTPYKHEGDELDHCQRCDGSFLDHGVAAQTYGPEMNPEFWKQNFVTKLPTKSKLLCPRCRDPLDAYVLKLDASDLEIDECTKCHGMWFDKNEGFHLRKLMQDSVLHAEVMTDRKGTIKGYLFQVLTQFPVEVWNPVRHRPWLVYSLLAGLTAIFIIQLINMESLLIHYRELMMVPADIIAGEHLWTIVTAGFLHADWMHLIGNLWMLWIFGDNVEDRLRKKHFVFLYMAALLAGNLAHLLSAWGDQAPLLGASGAISGLLGAYLVLFPRVKVWAMIIVIRIKISILWYVAIWIGFQVVMVFMGSGGVAWFAHFGGFLCGAGYAWLLKPTVLQQITAPRKV